MKVNYIKGEQLDKILDKVEKNKSKYNQSMLDYISVSKGIFEIEIGENAKVRIGAFCDWSLGSTGLDNYYIYFLKPHRKQKRRMKQIYNYISGIETTERELVKNERLKKLLGD